MTLKAELRAMALATVDKLTEGYSPSGKVAIVESALHAAVKRVLELEPSLEMLNAGIGVWAANDVTFGGVYRAMTKQLLREIEE